VRQQALPWTTPPLVSACGVFLAWPLYKLVEANAPRNYDPSDIPEELVQTQSGGTNWLSWIRN
jgi:hypothetical protein